MSGPEGDVSGVGDADSGATTDTTAGETATDPPDPESGVVVAPERVPSPSEFAARDERGDAADHVDGDDATCVDDPEADAPTGTVVWHREHLRTADQPALAAAAARSDRVLPLFVFDPTFYGDRGLACDARVAFMHDCLRDLDRQYRAACGTGLTLAHGDPVAVLERFVDAGWDVVAPLSPTGRYGLRRDERVRERCGVRFVSGDGLVRGVDDPRENWQERVETWLTDDQYDWDPTSVAVDSIDTGVGVEQIADTYDVTPQKTMVPEGGTAAAWDQLAGFVDRIADYPGNISSPVDARDGTSGLSPYLRFGCLSVRQVFQHVHDAAPACRGREMFVSRLFWNLHYRQKLEDWPGWLDTACNPELEGFNAHRRDPELIAAWKDGETGFPMVDASMRCLRETGWLNFRMRALCVSCYYHVLQQPWWDGADYFHEHLVDSVAAINYTQWQYQCGLVGKPTLRLYNPAKQVRDQDPDGEFVRRWVPELADLPDEHLPRPEKTPLAVQRECGVRIGEDYPYPVREFEAAKEEFWDRYEAVQPRAAARLADPEVARRASLSGGYDAARAIAAEYGESDEEATGDQTSLGAFESATHR
ncbi:FAD-binding domain-containing protein [Halobaculum sp. MBLA0147]|uniref:FAD-binding domain-containing protein n=1 Tax=Halobaculum sp. MBLA0147 TaxID=3079934 RepID=UPI0035240E9F